MHIIQQAYTLFYKIADKQPSFTGLNQLAQKPRLMKYVIQQPVDDGMLLFNTLTCECLFLDRSEYTRILENKTLRENWFVVPEDFDEMLFVHQLRPILKAAKQEKGVNKYTILTTTDCNARCFYCYEKGHARTSMSKETARKVSAYIIQNYRRSETQEPVRLNWFGGEPLYNLAVIDQICTDLKEARIPYKSSIISNGYLFTPEVVKRAQTQWNLHAVQITLDGTEDVYNKCKSYHQIQGSAYQRVIRNIQCLLDAKIKVFIRMNLDLHNADNLMLLADELKDLFASNQSADSRLSKNLSCYSLPLFEEYTHVSTANQRPLVYQKWQALQTKLKDDGLRGNDDLPTCIPTNHCMADDEQSVIIAPTGDLGKCEHYIDSDFFSHIDNPEKKDTTILKKFAEKGNDIDLCNDCTYYPLCLRLNICLDEDAPNELKKNQKIAGIHDQMLEAYARWKNQEAKETESSEEALSDDSKKAPVSESIDKEVSERACKIYPLLDKYVAVIHSDKGYNRRIIRLNEIGKDIFEMYISGKTLEQTAAALLEMYETSEQEITGIIRRFTNELSQYIH